MNNDKLSANKGQATSQEKLASSVKFVKEINKQDEALTTLIRDLVTDNSTKDGNFDNISYTLKQVFTTGKQEQFNKQLGLFVTQKV